MPMHWTWFPAWPMPRHVWPRVWHVSSPRRPAAGRVCPRPRSKLRPLAHVHSIAPVGSKASFLSRIPSPTVHPKQPRRLPPVSSSTCVSMRLAPDVGFPPTSKTSMWDTTKKEETPDLPPTETDRHTTNSTIHPDNLAWQEAEVWKVVQPTRHVESHEQITSYAYSKITWILHPRETKTTAQMPRHPEEFEGMPKQQSLYQLRGILKVCDAVWEGPWLQYLPWKIPRDMIDVVKPNIAKGHRRHRRRILLCTQKRPREVAAGHERTVSFWMVMIPIDTHSIRMRWLIGLVAARKARNTNNVVFVAFVWGHHKKEWKRGVKRLKRRKVSTSTHIRDRFWRSKQL